MSGSPELTTRLDYATILSQFPAQPNGSAYEYRLPVPVTQALTADNPRLRSPLPSSESAIVVVHPGFVHGEYSRMLQTLNAGSGSLTSTEQFRAEQLLPLLRGKHGDYEEYFRNVSRLTAALGGLTAPSVLCLQESTVYDPRPGFPQTPIHPTTFLWVTQEGAGHATSRVFDGTEAYGSRPAQRPRLLSRILRESGVKEIHLAGEYTHLPDIGSTGCAGYVARCFEEDGFRVRGIEGAVFPVMPRSAVTASPRDENAPAANEVVDRLYTNMVPLSKVLSAAPTA